MFIAPLLLAVTTLAQDTTPPVPRATTPKRHRAAVAIAPMVVSVDALEAAATALVTSTAQLDAITVQAPVLAASAVQLEALAALDVPSHIDVALPSEAWDQQDPADS